MEEVDNIIIHSLVQIGCTIEEDVKSLKQFSIELVIDAAVRCLEVIEPGLGIPYVLPTNLSARFRVASSIAQACQEAGYPGDVGFQTFLYWSENDVRKIFMFLIEKLPREAEKTIVEPVGSLAYIRKAIKEKLKSQLSLPWVPSYCLSNGIRWLDDGSFSQEGCGGYRPFLPEDSVAQCGNSVEELNKAWRDYYAKHLPTLSQNASAQRQLLPTLISLNSRGLLAESSQPSVASGLSLRTSQWMSECFAKELELCPAVEEDSAHEPVRKSRLEALQKVVDLDDRPKLGNKPKIAPRPKGLEVDASVGQKRSKADEVAKMKEETEVLRQQCDDLEITVKTLSAKLTQLSEDSAGEERALTTRGEMCAVKRRTYALLPEAEAGLADLRGAVEGGALKLVGLAAQWEAHRAPLLQRYRQARQHNSDKASESQRQADAVRGFREKGKELQEELRNKEQHHAQLLAEYEKVPKDINRIAYTRRILEIIGNICKQKEEIGRVLKDTKDLQKEINNLGGQLDRSFTVADELIFKDAKRDEASRRAYKLLATLHSDCGELVQTVQDAGATVREIRDLEEQIEMESGKNVGANLERISADLKQMKQESAVLTAQIKSKS